MNEEGPGKTLGATTTLVAVGFASSIALACDTVELADGVVAIASKDTATDDLAELTGGSGAGMVAGDTGGKEISGDGNGDELIGLSSSFVVVVQEIGRVENSWPNCWSQRRS